MAMLGYKVKDRITGFTGVVTGQVKYISGCNQALVVPAVDKDGKLVEGQWFDEQRLDVDVQAAQIILDNSTSHGFDKAAPKR